MRVTTPILCNIMHIFQIFIIIIIILYFNLKWHNLTQLSVQNINIKQTIYFALCLQSSTVLCFFAFVGVNKWALRLALTFV